MPVGEEEEEYDVAGDDVATSAASRVAWPENKPPTADVRRRLSGSTIATNFTLLSHTFASVSFSLPFFLATWNASDFTGSLLFFDGCRLCTMLGHNPLSAAILAPSC